MAEEEFVATVSQNPVVSGILSRLEELAAPDPWLTAGCLSQTYWNLQTGRPPTQGIRDYDLFYFDED